MSSVERAALEKISHKQPEVLAMIRANGFVFDSLGKEPGNWQHLAFTLYTEICEIDMVARSALGEDDVGPPAPGEGGDLENPEIGMVC